ncbi:MAG TPA: BatA domain-containing protein [Tepidisphaeraceae bacterium]|nr:BatA domain-containing protein [Tepidisphaeraceae bacterium]
MFLNAIMLAGIGGAVVPLVLHLLNRYRFRTVQWGAMMFLAGDDRRQTRRHRLRQIILLLIRMALVALLAVCLARPIVYSHWGAEPAPAAVVILLDRSPAMGMTANRRSRMTRAEGAVTAILSTLQSGDEVTLVSLGEVPGQEQEGGSTTDLAALADRVQAMNAGPALASVADGLERAAEILGGSDRTNRQIFIVCGKEASAWKDVDERFAESWRRRWPAAATPKIVVVAVGSQNAENVAVTGVRLAHPPALRGRATEVMAIVHNYGFDQRDRIPVNFRVAGKVVASTLVSVSGRSEAIARQTVIFPEAGSHILSAQIPQSGLPSDNVNELSLDVMDSLPVMIVGKPDARFIAMALAPYQAAGRDGPDLAHPVVMDAAGGAWTEQLQNFSVVVLADVPWLSVRQTQALEMYVYAGGGLLIAPGDGVRAEDYNDSLYRDGTGLMPAMLQAPTPADGSGATTIERIDRVSPVFDFLADQPAYTPAPVIRRYFPATVGPGGEELASFRGGRPFVVEGNFGKGRVILVTTALDENWGTLPLDSFFLPFVQSMVSHLAAQPSARNLQLGQTLVAHFDQPVEGKVRVTMPGGLPSVELAPQGGGNDWAVQYLPGVSGEYDVVARINGQDRTERFVVRRPDGVSDLLPVGAAGWSGISRLLDCQVIDSPDGDVAAQFGGAARQWELWPWLLAMVIGLAVAEVGLERLWTTQPA